jgi:hypothetical protein
MSTMGCQLEAGMAEYAMEGMLVSASRASRTVWSVLDVTWRVENTLQVSYVLPVLFHTRTSKTVRDMGERVPC